jgi:hypothetical protein
VHPAPHRPLGIHTVPEPPEGVSGGWVQVERLEKEHVADSRRMRQMEEAALKAQSRLKASERSLTEAASRYEARRPHAHVQLRLPSVRPAFAPRSPRTCEAPGKRLLSLYCGRGRQALELLMQKLQLKMSVCDGERGEPRTLLFCSTARRVGPARHCTGRCRGETAVAPSLDAKGKSITTLSNVVAWVKSPAEQGYRGPPQKDERALTQRTTHAAQ